MRFESHYQGNFCAVVGDILYVHPSSGLNHEDNRARQGIAAEGLIFVRCELEILRSDRPFTLEEFMAALLLGG
jgi:hypothetical protein